MAEAIPDRVIVVVVGDAAKFDAPLSRFGAVKTLNLIDTTASREG